MQNWIIMINHLAESLESQSRSAAHDWRDGVQQRFYGSYMEPMFSNARIFFNNSSQAASSIASDRIKIDEILRKIKEY